MSHRLIEEYYQGENNAEVSYDFSSLDNKTHLRSIGGKFSDAINEITEQFNTPAHYDNSKGSLYKFAEDHKLNAYEFDIIKRVVRCRKKGQFIEDIDKTIALLELYKKEYNEKMD